MRTTRTTRTFGALATTLVLSLVAACGGSDHDDADVSFAQDMLVHHAQALDMVEMTEGRPLDPEVEALAREIEDAQAPEIETFTSWLEEWDEDVPDTSGRMPSMKGMEGMDEMPGMMSAGDMEDLEDAPDREFQRRWLEMMVEHHEGAVAMAQKEVDEGEHQPAVDLARTIARSQTREIATMKELLAG